MVYCNKKAEETGHEHDDAMNSPQGDAGDVTASFDEFPNLHPLIVHFPIVLLLLAAASQIVSFFIFKTELSWVTLALLAGGFAGAYAAGILTHPHTAELSPVAQKVLDEHDFYAYLTIWSSGIGLVVKAASQFLFKRKVWAELIVLIPLLLAAYGVSMAGHHGSQLVFIEGVGPQGKYLETEGHGH
jgi:uncharacterized membrane protein